MLTKEEIKQKILEDDFVNSKKYGYSLEKYKRKNPTSPDNVIAHLLCITPKEVQIIYDGIVEKARLELGIDL